MPINSRNRRKYIKKSKKNIKGGNISSFLSNRDSDQIIEIGRGAYGKVYIDVTQPDSVFKVSEDGKCQGWLAEIEIYKILNKNNIDTDLCKLIKMKDFVNDGKNCCIELTRAINPRGIELRYVIQPLFQNQNYNYHHPTRGLFLGLTELISENIFTIDNIKEYINQLAILIARLHYKLKNNTADIELYISNENSKIIIYIGDFDRVKFIDNYDDTAIEALATNLWAVEYFPCTGELYDIFLTSYIKEASIYGMQSIAERVLELYQSKCN